ncbi:MAG: uroporphyrinogen-III C-methyltransferase [Rhodospirillales bacterium]|nr:uroporphyrinogen-III C-methyltransferase [Rhodospirillales bacterium]
MEHFPAFFALKGRPALVVGGGAAAARKARLLSDAGAAVSVVAPALDHEMEALIERGLVRHRNGTFAADDLDGQTLAIAASGGVALDEAVSEAAQARGVPVNVVDAPRLSTFIMPAVVRRDPVTVAVSTGGAAPVLARAIRASIEALLPANLGRLARFADGFRGAVKATHGDEVGRRRFWERFFAGPIAAAVLAGDERWARERMLDAVNRRPAAESGGGSVALVGAGPGDADLLTVRALRLLEEADVIVHDRLIGPDVLDRARRDARRIDVGKRAGAAAMSQERINALLLREARAGRRVVRLKGGDPFIFGRGGEEAEYLRGHGVHVSIVPGITAATGCAAIAGIPLTHRDHVQALTFVTGRGRDGDPDVDWAGLARGRQTIVVYMGRAAAERIAGRLMAAGMDPATPAAMIVNATLAGQRVETAPLVRLGAVAGGEGGGRANEGPSLFIIGEVVRHADAWSEATRAPALLQAVGV